MTSLLFIYPPISFKEQGSLSAYCPPLGVLYLGTMLKHNGHNVHVLDAEAEQLSINQIVSRVKSINPDVIGLTCLTFTLDSCKRLIKAIKKTTDAYIAVGGPHISVAPENSLKQIGADVCVIGEAEAIINDLVEQRPQGIVRTEEFTDIDKIPYPDQTLINHVHYGAFYGLKFGDKVTGILTTRGCKWGCSYCNRPKKRNFRARSPRNIVKELKQLDRMGYDSIWLADDNFTNYPENVIKLARLIKQEKLKFHFYGQARVDVPSEPLYQAIREMGILGLSYGVESLNPNVIKWYQKTPHPEKWPKYVKKTLRLCDKYNIAFLGSLIFGAPMETKEDMEYSINFLNENGADIINGNILLYLLGSPLWSRAVKDGMIQPDQHIISAPDTGLTPYSHEELAEMTTQCTNLSKDNWKRVFGKLLKGQEFGLITSSAKRLIRHYAQVRKVRKVISNYGYGKKGYTWND